MGAGSPTAGASVHEWRQQKCEQQHKKIVCGVCTICRHPPTKGVEGDVTAPRKLAATPAGISFESEHIVLETIEVPRLEVASVRRILDHCRLDNRSRGIATEFTFFDKGFLGVREERRGDDGDEIVLELRHLDPRPVLTRSFAAKSLAAGLGSLGLSLLTAAAAYVWTVPALLTVPAICASLAAGAVALWLFVRHTRNEVTFRTRHAQTAVLTLTANLGCFQAYRAFVPRLVSEINKARAAHPSDKQQQLKDETREHYRLRDAGALNDEDCGTGTRRLLAQFG
jgi:hypothetical protein